MNDTLVVEVVLEDVQAHVAAHAVALALDAVLVAVLVVARVPATQVVPTRATEVVIKILNLQRSRLLQKVIAPL